VARDWDELIEHESAQPYFAALRSFLERERSEHRVFPPVDEELAALRITPRTQTKVVILGQDPYHGEGQAHGLSFSVRSGVRIPPSLRNILGELHDDTGVPVAGTGDLTAWAGRGVLLLNTTLTVREGEAGSHHGRGWETFTDAVIASLNEKAERTVFVLWGNNARRKKSLITNPAHFVLESAHPSPLSARNGFFGSRPFSRANEALTAAGVDPVDWALPTQQ
jgi:uracil-DNA glycosylase